MKDSVKKSQNIILRIDKNISYKGKSFIQVKFDRSICRISYLNVDHDLKYGASNIINMFLLI